MTTEEKKHSKRHNKAGHGLGDSVGNAAHVPPLLPATSHPINIAGPNLGTTGMPTTALKPPDGTSDTPPGITTDKIKSKSGKVRLRTSHVHTGRVAISAVNPVTLDSSGIIV